MRVKCRKPSQKWQSRALEWMARATAEAKVAMSPGSLLDSPGMESSAPTIQEGRRERHGMQGDSASEAELPGILAGPGRHTTGRNENVGSGAIYNHGGVPTSIPSTTSYEWTPGRQQGWLR